MHVQQGVSVLFQLNQKVIKNYHISTYPLESLEKVRTEAPGEFFVVDLFGSETQLLFVSSQHQLRLLEDKL